MQSYTDFARVYDQLMSDVDYASWSAFYLSLAASQNIKTCADIACGTGSFTIPFARQFQTTGIDISEDMLMIAREKAQKAGLAIPFAKMDIQNFSLHKPVDLVTCCCDGINYLLTDTAVEKTFSCVFDALNPGGLFLFDISSPHKLHKMDKQVFFDDQEAITLLWDNHMRGDILTMDILFFVKERSGLYQKHQEAHTQKAHTRASIEKALKIAGFVGIQVFGGMEKRPAVDTDDRLHFLAKKPA